MKDSVPSLSARGSDNKHGNRISRRQKDGHSLAGTAVGVVVGVEGGVLGYTLDPKVTGPGWNGAGCKGPPTLLTATQGLEESTGPLIICSLLAVQFTVCVRV